MNKGDLVKVKNLNIIGRIQDINNKSIKVKYRTKQDKWVGYYLQDQLEFLARKGYSVCRKCNKTYKGFKFFCSDKCKGLTKECKGCKNQMTYKLKTKKFCKSCVSKRTNISNIRRYNKKNKVGFIPSEDNLVYPDYKEPLRRVEDGFGYLGTVAYTKDGEGIQCHICGLVFKNCANHIFLSHNIKAKDYKEKFELSQSTSLISLTHRKKLQSNYVKLKKQLGRSICEFIPEKKKKELAKKTSKRNSNNNVGVNMSLEVRNKRGNCPDQLADKFFKCKEDLGHTPSVKEFKSYCGNNKLTGTIYHYYKSWDDFVNKLGEKTKRQLIEERYTDERLIQDIKDFYKRYGYTPKSADFENDSSLVSSKVYVKRFKSLNHARMKAGIPIVIPLSKFKFVETMEYEKYYL